MSEVNPRTNSEDEIVFPIEGMSCASCQLRVDEALRTIDGVKAAHVNLLAHRASVRFDPRRVSPDDLVAAVERVGFDASLPLAAVAIVDRTRTEDVRRRYEFRNLAIRASLSALVALVAMVTMGRGHRLLPHQAMPFVEAFVVLASLGLGWPIFRRGARELWVQAPGMDALVTLGSGAALVLTVAASMQITGFAGQHHADGIPTLVAALLIGRALEARAKGETLLAQAELAALLPSSSVLLRDGQAIVVPTRDLLPGDDVRVGAGEPLPCDGTVMSGTSDTDEAAITGEARPVPKAAGSEVIGGTRNGLGELVVRVHAVGDGTALAAILRSAENAQAHRGRLENLAERAIRPFVPAMITVALVTAFVWTSMGGAAAALLHGANVLLVACPCALGLAIPAALTVALGRASSLGVLVHRGSAIESAAAVTDACFDKTGTLTTGTMTVSEARPAENTTEAELRAAAAIAEDGLDHPIARALQSPKGNEAGWSRVVAPGKGVVASRGGEGIVAGTSLFVGDTLGVEVDDPPDSVGSAIAVARNGIFLGHLAVSDSLRPSAPPLVEALRARGIAITVLTGDDAVYTESILAPLRVAVRARMTPEGKRAAIEELRQSRKDAVVLFVGDGINDAPALASADISIAMASGTAIARSTGDALLLSSDVRIIVPFLSLARHTVRTMRRNLAWAVVYNVIALPVAAGVFEGIGLVMTPTVAGACMAASSLGVLLQSLSLRFVRLDRA